jgi:hypothetical protein
MTAPLMPFTGCGVVAPRLARVGRGVMTGRRRTCVALNAMSSRLPPFASRVRILPLAVYTNSFAPMKCTGNGNMSSPFVTALPFTTRLPAVFWYARFWLFGVHWG